DVSYGAFLPSLINRGQLIEGYSKLEATRSVAGLVGPSMAGVVIQFISPPVAIALDTFSFFAFGGIIATIKQREPRGDDPERQPMIVAVREGLSIVFGNRLLRSIAACTATINFFYSAVWALYILFATRDLGLSAAKIGLIFSVGNIGGLLGAVVAGKLGVRLGIGPVIVASGFLIGLGWLPVVLATPRTAFPLLVLASLLTSFSSPVYN